MQSLLIQYLSSLSLTIEDARTLQRLGEYKGRQELFTQQTPQILQSLKTLAIIESSESSNRLEGVTAPKDRIEALVTKNSTPKNRSEQEIAGYRDALNLIHESGQHMPFTNNVILQMHSMLYRYLPMSGGKWKGIDNEIIERNADGSVRRIRFKPTSAADTPEAMEQLALRYKDAIQIHNQEPLVVVPLAILDFLCVHPFVDGNGRSARLLTLLLLYHFGYEVGRYISLERIFEESKETYYETLEASSKNWHEGKHNSFPWLRYFWGALLRAYQEFEERVGQIETSRGSKTEHVKSAVRRRIAPFAISDIEKDCPGVSRDMIRLVLRELKKDGLISPQGKGRGARWLYTGDLQKGNK